MTRLPFALRLFWFAFYIVSILLVVGVPVGPTIETWLAPVRAPGAIEHVGIGPAYLWFDWVGEKLRTPATTGADVTMYAVGDQFDLSLFNDESRRGEPRCTRLSPWSQLHLVDSGYHRQAFCIELPPQVKPGSRIHLLVAPRYRGFAGLWEVRSSFPPIVLD